MQQYQLNRTLFHIVIDFFIPDNCRMKLEKAFNENHAASSRLLRTIHQNEHQIVAAFKDDRRSHFGEHRYDRT